jgi:hypothetical protein
LRRPRLNLIYRGFTYKASAATVLRSGFSYAEINFIEPD